MLHPPAPSFVDETAGPAEIAAFRAWLREGAATEALAPELAPIVLFAAKEAALKWIGVGLRLGLRELELRPIERTRLRLAVGDEQLELDVRVRIEAERALVAIVGPDPTDAHVRLRARCDRDDAAHAFAHGTR
jgi:phosphopantetheinyl transferase